MYTERWQYEVHLLRRGYEPRAFFIMSDVRFDEMYDALAAHGCLDDGDGFHVPPTDEKLMRLHSPKALALLRGTRTPRELIQLGDRSSALWHVMQTFRRMGYGPGQAYLAIWGSPVGEKPREKGREWFIDQLETAWATREPASTRIDDSSRYEVKIRKPGQEDLKRLYEKLKAAQ